MPRIRLLLVLVAAGALLAAPFAHGATSTIVVSQIYAGGGNAGATYTNDFVELFNRGAAAVNLAGWTIQYASGASTSWQTTPLSGSIGPGRYYLVQLASTAAVGSPLPAADATGTANLATAGGKVALVRDSVALTCGATAGSCSSAPLVEDLVGYGSATDYEGVGPAPALGSTTAALRAGGGCTDTNANANGLHGRYACGAQCSIAFSLLFGRNGAEPNCERSGRRRRAACAVGLARTVERELWERRLWKLSDADLRESHRREHERARLLADRASLCFCTERPPARDRSSGRWSAGLDSGFAGTRPPCRKLVRTERRGRRHVADQHRFRVGRSGRRAGPLHGNAHLHGDRAVIAAAAGIVAATLSVSPVHIRLAGAGNRTITIMNTGGSEARLKRDRRASSSTGAAGRRSRGSAVLRPGGCTCNRGSSRSAPAGRRSSGLVCAPAGALPGDHPALVLFTTRPSRSAGVAIRMRVGVVVFVRVAGRIVHRVELGALRARLRALELVVTNRGNVVESARARILLLRGGRVLARLSSAGRTLLPHSRAVERFRRSRPGSRMGDGPGRCRCHPAPFPHPALKAVRRLGVDSGGLEAVRRSTRRSRSRGRGSRRTALLSGVSTGSARHRRPSRAR